MDELAQWLIDASKIKGTDEWNEDLERQFNEVAKLYKQMREDPVGTAKKGGETIADVAEEGGKLVKEGIESLPSMDELKSDAVELANEYVPTRKGLKGLLDKVTPSEETQGTALDVLLSGGPSGYLSGNRPAPTTTGKVDVPDWSIPDHVVHRVGNLAKSAYRGGKAMLGGSVDGVQAIVEGASTAAGNPYENVSKRNSLEPGQKLPEEMQEQFKDKGEWWLKFNDLERRDDGIYAAGKPWYENAVRNTTIGAGLLWAPAKAGKVTSNSIDLARRFHVGEIREGSKFKDELIKVISEKKKKGGKPTKEDELNADLVQEVLSNSKKGDKTVPSFTKAPALNEVSKKIGPKGVKEISREIANRLRPSEMGRRLKQGASDDLTAVGGKVKNKASEYQDRIRNATRNELKVAGTNIAYKTTGFAAGLYAEYKVADSVVKNVLDEYGSENLTEQDKNEMGYWYASNYLVTHGFKSMIELGIPDEALNKRWVRVASLIGAEISTLGFGLAVSTAEDQDAFVNDVSRWADEIINEGVESGKISAEDAQVGKDVISGKFDDVIQSGPSEDTPVNKNSGGLLYPKKPMMDHKKPIVGLLGR